jgi:hypothetical protein
MCRFFAPALAAATCLLIAVPGCGPKKVKVSGRLVKNGAVQTYHEDQYITLQFVPVDTGDTHVRSYPAKVNPTAGTYEVELLAGKYHISLFIAPPQGSKPGTALPPTRPNAAATDANEYDFTSSTTHDITVP